MILFVVTCIFTSVWGYWIKEYTLGNFMSGHVKTEIMTPVASLINVHHLGFEQDCVVQCQYNKVGWGLMLICGNGTSAGTIKPGLVTYEEKELGLLYVSL